jgi:hypothetical protein
MVNWMIKNMLGEECDVGWKFTRMANFSNFLYVNEGNIAPDLTENYINEHIDELGIIFIAYENTRANFSAFVKDHSYKGSCSFDKDFIVGKTQENKRIVLIRDFYNTLASRISSNNKKLSRTEEGEFYPWDVGKGFIAHWKDMARYIVDFAFPHLKYEDWLLNKEKRENFLKEILGHGELEGIKVKGSPSSFDDTKRGRDTLGCMNRFKQISWPEETKKMINDDSELFYLMGRLGYDYKIL